MERAADKLGAVVAAALVVAVGGWSDAGVVALLLAGVSCAALCALPGLPDATLEVAPVALLALAAALPGRGACLVPLAAYDLARSRRPWLACLCLVPLALAAATHAAAAPCALAAVAGVSLSLLAMRTTALIESRTAAHALQDDLQDKVYVLDRSRRELVEARDGEARAAALAERGRISREIHDSVGHMLTRTILQIEALEVVHADEDAVLSDLAAVADGVREALDVTRRTVHAMADDAVDLETELRVMARDCGIADVRVAYDADGTPPAELSRCIAAVVRESLTNAARHGRASRADVRVRELPALWQVVVTNDGEVPGAARGGRPFGREDATAAGGMGVRSMWERVDALGGVFRISADPRFSVFASIPKER